MKEETCDALFDGIVQTLQDENVRKLVNPDQKQAVLDALDVSVEVISDDRVKMKFLFMVLDIDTTDENNPSINMSFDLVNLKKVV